jgi:hypothetical protein
MNPRIRDNPSQLRRYLIPALVLAFLAASLAAFFIFADNRNGNDDQSSAGETPNPSEVAVEAGAMIVGPLDADDVKLQPGMKYVFTANSPGRTTDVDFNLEGPWDFTDGPDQTTLTMSTLDSENAPGAEYFNDASVAVYSTWSHGRSKSNYSFQSFDSDLWLAYGYSGEAGLVRFKDPSQAMIFPASIGDSWVDEYQQVEAGSSTDIKAENRLVSFNTLTVPAGTFDAYLLQIKVTSSNGGKPTVTWDYVWLAPGIGRTAEIISQPAEKDEVFDRAYAFYRLEQYGNA